MGERRKKLFLETLLNLRTLKSEKNLNAYREKRIRIKLTTDYLTATLDARRQTFTI